MIRMDLMKLESSVNKRHKQNFTADVIDPEGTSRSASSLSVPTLDAVTLEGPMF